MTIHTGAVATSESDPDTFDQGLRTGSCDQSQFSEKLAELGLKRINAYVRVARADAKISKATEDKRRYREQQKAKGIGQYPVEVPYDEDARHAVYAVAKAIVADKDNTKNVRSTILSVASSAALLELVQLLSASQVDLLSIVGMIERGDLVKLDAIHTARPGLLDDLSHLAKSNDDFLSVLDCLVRHAGDISDGSALGLLDAAAAASGCPKLLRCS